MLSIKMLAVLGLLAAAPASAWAHGDRHHENRWHGRPVHVTPVRRPVWVPGYWAHRGPRPVWQVGVWATPPQAGWVWVAPQWGRERGHRVWRDGYWAPSQAPYVQAPYAQGY
jgi:hypothetical protein